MSGPRVSVLLATKNRPDRLLLAVEAILAQDWPNLEVVVKDGGTVPAPLPSDDRVFRVHGADAGIAHAFNEAARFATGNIFHNANDDDLMLPGTIRSAVEALVATGAQWTYGMLRYYDESTGVETVQADPWPWQPHEMLNLNCVHQPTVFYTRQAWNDLGPFNEHFKYAYDYEWWGRLGSVYEPVVRAHHDAEYHFWPGSTSVATPELVNDDAAAIQVMWREVGFGNRR